MADYKRSITLPFTSFKKISIGAFFMFLMFILSYSTSLLHPFVAENVYFYTLKFISTVASVILSFFITGYALTAAKESMKKRFVLPEWTDFASIFRRGFFSFVISFIWLGIPIILLSGLIAVIGISGIVGGGGILAAFAAIPSIILLALIAIVLAYVHTAALFAYLKKDSLIEAFDVSRAFRKAFTVNWFLAALVGLAWAFVLGLISALILVLTFWTVFIPAIALSYAEVISIITFYSLLGQAYVEK